MRAWVCGVAVTIGVAALWVLSGTQHSASLLAATTETLRSLEAGVAAHPDNPEATRKLAQAYLDARQPGLARVLLDAAPDTVKTNIRARHVLARALLDEGRSDLALDVENGVIAACRPFDGDGPTPGCDTVLLASAVRRTSILREMVSMGVMDALARPEASLVAYQNATREARIRVE